MYQNRTLAACAALIAAAGCGVPDAPESLEDLVVFGFEHFEDKDTVVQQVADDLQPLLAQHAEDLAAGFRVSNLTAAHLEAAGVEDAAVTGVVGALGLVEYQHSIDDVLAVIVREDKAALFDHLLEYSVDSETDRACFLARECDNFEQTITETSSIALLGEATRTYDVQFRWVERSDGETVLLIRNLSPDPLELSSNVVKIHQQYALVALFETGGDARRAETFWVDAEVIGLDIPDSFAVDTAVSSMGAQAERIDLFLDEG